MGEQSSFPLLDLVDYALQNNIVQKITGPTAEGGIEFKVNEDGGLSTVQHSIEFNGSGEPYVTLSDGNKYPLQEALQIDGVTMTPKWPTLSDVSVSAGPGFFIQLPVLHPRQHKVVFPDGSTMPVWEALKSRCAMVLEPKATETGTMLFPLHTEDVIEGYFSNGYYYRRSEKPAAK
ncbi:MAG: hypothetical protein V1735_06150 [Nanoarchaeota archaeon]